MKLIAAALMSAALALPVGDPAGFVHWKSADLKGYAKTLAPKINDHHVASQPLDKFGNYLFQIAHRDGACRHQSISRFALAVISASSGRSSNAPPSRTPGCFDISAIA